MRKVVALPQAESDPPLKTTRDKLASAFIVNQQRSPTSVCRASTNLAASCAGTRIV